MRPGSHVWAVLGLTALGAALRFPTLDRQSYWLDELVTVSLLRRDLGDMLGQIPETEATPYLYYVLAWLWASAFGLGEVGLRSFSALAGTATVPVAYGAGAALVSRRAGVVAAALVAVSPFLVWYSQEARSYALLVLLGAGSLLAFAKALERERLALVTWALVSALAVATHYFAVFLVSAEAAWLVYRLGPRRLVLVASLVPTATFVAHVPLVLEQRGNAEAVTESSLAVRAGAIPKHLAVGYSFPAEVAGSVVAAGLLLAGLVLLLRTAASIRRRAFLAGVIASASVVVPTGLALVGSDFLVSRNLAVAVVPAAVCLGAGYAASRLGLGVASSLCLLLAAISLAPALDTRYGRTDWRGVAERLGSPPGARAIVVTPFMSRSLWSPYLPGLREPDAEGERVREVAVVALATEGGYSAGPVEPPRGEPAAAPEAFALVSVEREPSFTLVRYRAERPRVVSNASLERLALADTQPGLLVQDQRGPG